jgi:hypothetical protein
MYREIIAIYILFSVILIEIRFLRTIQKKSKLLTINRFVFIAINRILFKLKGNGYFD